MFAALVAGLGSSIGSRGAAADATPTLSVGYVHDQHSVETISLVFQPAADNGRAGAEVGVADNNTTGRFLQQNFVLQTVEVPTGQDPVPALQSLLAKGIRLVVTDLPAAGVLRLADAGASHGVVLFNAEAPDDALREQNCRANLIHTAPSNTMLADALAQYLIWKRWSRWFLVYGMEPDDLLLADAYRNAAKVFGARIVADRQYKGRAGSRETDSGLIELQQQLPVFTQNAPDYDVLVCADQHDTFAGYLPYRTWTLGRLPVRRVSCRRAGIRTVPSSAADRSRTGSWHTHTV